MLETEVIKIYKTGGPEEMKWEKITLPTPSSNQVLIKHSVVGLNYIDTYHRSGLYPLPLPSSIGMEASGVILEKGNKVNDFNVGDRVAYASPPPGSYSKARLMNADKVIKIPENIPDDVAAACMLKGMTVEYLIKRTYKVQSEDTVLFHAAAGGVGLIACQWLKSIGATIIGTVGSEDKAKLAKENGCDHTILYKTEDFVERVKQITDGKGVPVVYDGVGKDTALKGLDCLSPLGMMVIFGNSSGNADPVNPGILAAKGSLFLTRPTLMTYTASRKDLLSSANEVFTAIQKKHINIKIGSKYDIADVVQAHRDLESRKTTGSVIFTI